ncbi:MAG: preprotein translocase subunit YajC [Magnetococcales bacterium]|nr:preprotein translocase subunit YajC [Magnetococcales bacterium]
MFDLISVAHAEAAAGSGGGAAMGNIIFMVLLFAIFYFLLIRPQQKQQKAHKEMVENLRRGDSVVTNGGLMGKIHRVEDDVVTLEVGEVEIGNKSFRPVRLRLRRASVSAITTKGGAPTTEEVNKIESKDGE